MHTVEIVRSITQRILLDIVACGEKLHQRASSDLVQRNLRQHLYILRDGLHVYGPRASGLDAGSGLIAHDCDHATCPRRAVPFITP